MDVLKINNIVKSVTYPTQVATTDPYELDIQTVTLHATKEPGVNQLITSKSLCTPGCGNTGTGNSFCC